MVRGEGTRPRDEDEDESGLKTSEAGQYNVDSAKGTPYRDVRHVHTRIGWLEKLYSSTAGQGRSETSRGILNRVSKNKRASGKESVRRA